MSRVYATVSKPSENSPEVRTSTHRNGLTTRTVRASGDTFLLVRETTKDLAGFPIESKSPDNNGDGTEETTLMATTYPATGGVTETTTRPDGSTTITSTYRDGRQKSISGTATTAMTYDYGTHDINGGGTWTRTTMANGTESEIDYSDLLGRTFRTTTPDGHFSQSTFHNEETADPGSRGRRATSPIPMA